ncbi:MAG: SET domain-containing protein-lysine N-methyltransferase [Gallionellaceae bacterium]|nr:SET domain-containing protein-lysine N-methyltransferase [Gallionellaceae bacterium]
MSGIMLPAWTTTDDQKGNSMLRVESGTFVCGNSLVTYRGFSPGDIVYRLTDVKTIDSPSFRTIQVGKHKHVDDLEILAFLNHSCRPNTHIIIDNDELVIVAASVISPGEDLTFFYPATEWDMAQPFRCLCNAQNCLGFIAGAKHLPEDVLDRHPLSKHIQQLIAESRHHPQLHDDAVLGRTPATVDE